MELEDLDNINKSDFLPLLPHNIKEELLDAGTETVNLVCDSVERQVKSLVFWYIRYFEWKSPRCVCHQWFVSEIIYVRIAANVSIDWNAMRPPCWIANLKTWKHFAISFLTTVFMNVNLDRPDCPSSFQKMLRVVHFRSSTIRKPYQISRVQACGHLFTYLLKENDSALCQPIEHRTSCLFAVNKKKISAPLTNVSLWNVLSIDDVLVVVKISHRKKCLSVLMCDRTDTVSYDDSVQIRFCQFIRYNCAGSVLKFIVNRHCYGFVYGAGLRTKQLFFSVKWMNRNEIMVNLVACWLS